MNEPKKHHFIPEFYTKGWVGPDSRLCQFSVPYKQSKKVVASRVYPSQTGFVLRLYELAGLPVSIRQQVEDLFFKPLDTTASEALEAMRHGMHPAELSSKRRVGWVRFLISLLVRCPQDIRGLKVEWPKYLQAYAAEADQADESKALTRMLTNAPAEFIEQTIFELLAHLIENLRIGDTILDFHWDTVVFPSDAPRLLTSDAPVFWDRSFATPYAHIGLPLSPRHLFIAARDKDFIAKLTNSPAAELASFCNNGVVSGAFEYVYGMDDTQIEFVARRFGAKPKPRLLAEAFERMSSANLSSKT